MGGPLSWKKSSTKEKRGRIWIGIQMRLAGKKDGRLIDGGRTRSEGRGRSHKPRPGKKFHEKERTVPDPILI